MRQGEELKKKAKRFKCEISFNFKQLLIFMKCFQHTVALAYACNEKALFTTQKRKRRAPDRDGKREGGNFPCLSYLAQGSPVQGREIKHGLGNMTVSRGSERICL